MHERLRPDGARRDLADLYCHHCDSRQLFVRGVRATVDAILDGKDNFSAPHFGCLPRLAGATHNRNPLPTPLTRDY